MLSAKATIVAVAALAIGGAAWAAIVPPDSIYHNRVTDVKAAKLAHGELVALDQQSLGSREAWIFLHGLQYELQDNLGPSPEVVRRLFAGCETSFPALYEAARKEKFDSRVKIYEFRYNTAMNDWSVGLDLHRVIEGTTELTGARVRIVLLCHSKGGRIGQSYQYHSNGRKLVRGLTLGSPHWGSDHADPDRLTANFNKLYPGLAGKGFAAIGKSRVDFDTDGMKWLQPNHPGTAELHRLSPLDERWVLYAGTVTPNKGSIFSLAQLADGLWLGQDSAAVARVWCPIGAALIRAGGDTSGCDGLVSRNSAWGISPDGKDWAPAATKRLKVGYNHHEILAGKGGETEYFDQLLWDLVTFPPNTAEAKEFGKFDFQLPEIELFSLPDGSGADLVQARRVWTKRGELWVSSDKIETDGAIVGEQRVDLDLGEFSWPSWLGNNLVATCSTSKGADIVLIREDGRVVWLTNNGISQLAQAGDSGEIALLVDSQLCVRSTAGLTRVVISDRLNLASPPAIWGDKIYFACRADGGQWNTYWVSGKASHYRLAQAKLAVSNASQPVRVESPWGNLLVVTKHEGSTTKLVVILDQRWGASRAVVNRTLTELESRLVTAGLTGVEQVQFDQQVGAGYVVHQGWIRQFDPNGIAGALPGIIQEIVQGQVPSDPGVETWLPAIAEGTQLDIKE